MTYLFYRQSFALKECWICEIYSDESTRDRIILYVDEISIFKKIIRSNINGTFLIVLIHLGNIVCESYTFKHKLRVNWNYDIWNH